MEPVLRDIDLADEDAVLAGLARACARLRPDARPEREEWLWRTGANPAGRRAVGAFDGERLVAHFACVPRKVWIGAREANFCEWREGFALERPGGLVRRPLFVRLVEHVLSAGGAEDLALYGFPTPEEWRLANAQLAFEVVRNQSLLVRRELDREPSGELVVERLTTFDHQARWLWDRCCGSFGAGTIRDAAYLDWRFLQRPCGEYECLGVRDANHVLRGLAVLRPGRWAGREALWLVDWLVPPEEPDVGRALLGAAGARARRTGAAELATVLPDWSPWFDRFQCSGFRVVPSGRLLVARPGAKRFHEVWLRDHWWYTLGDFLDL